MLAGVRTLAQYTKVPSYGALQVIGHLLIVQEGLYGKELLRLTNLASGTLYPLLKRLESTGIVRSQWEEGDAKKLGRPPRRYYFLTDRGKRFGRRYNAETIANNPLLVPFEDFP